MKVNTKNLSVSMLLLLCKSASQMSKGGAPMLIDADTRGCRALEKRGLLHINEKGETSPTIEGFRFVKGLAPVPLMVVHEDNAIAVAPYLKDAFLGVVGVELAYLFANAPESFDSKNRHKPGFRSIRNIGELRKAMERLCPTKVDLIASDVALDIPVYLPVL